jgi:hypothetical protein
MCSTHERLHPFTPGSLERGHRKVIGRRRSNQRAAETERADFGTCGASLEGSIIRKSHLQSGHLVASEYTMWP